MADVSKALNVVRKLNPMGFFSRATEEAQRLPQAKGTGEQMRAMLLKQGVKPDELKWTGFDEWAKGKKSVTRDEITEYLRRNEVQLGEKRLGKKAGLSDDDFARNYDTLYDDYVAEQGSPPRHDGLLRDWANARNSSETAETAPKFQQYTLPGGKDYNELLLKAPYEKMQRVGVTSTGQIFTEEELANPIVRRTAEKIGLTMEDRMMPTMQPYRSQHWEDDPNVLAHMRMVGRTDPEGRRVLHLEELQSDWAQEGRKKGFTDRKAAIDQWVKDNAAAKEKYLEAQKQHSELADQIMLRQKPLEPFNPDIESQSSYDYRKQQYNNRRVSFLDADPDYRASAFNLGRLRDQTQSRGPDLSGIVPPAPFVESTPGWTNLAFKRAMIEAARGNYDAIAWTPGAEQAKRYNLSQHIGELEWSPDTNRLVAYGHNGDAVINRTATPDELSGLVGKEVAERLVATPQTISGNEARHTLSGLDLDVGGKGMKGYYDKILPTQIGKVLKDINETPQFGTVNVPTPTRDARYHRLDDAELMAELRQNGDPPQSMTLPSINLTPQMREKINQGLPLFTMMPAAVGLGATASQMQEGANPAEEPREGFDNGGPVDMRAGEMIGLRARLGLSPKKISDRAGPIHTDPAVAAARDAATVEAEPAVVEQALDVVRSQPAARPEPRALTVPAPRQAAPEPSESQRLWQLYNDSENPADFVRADEAMRAGRADGGRLLEDQYPTQYLPDVGRQVMQDGGSTMDGFMPPVSEEAPDDRGARWQAALSNYRNFPVRPGEATARPADLSARDVIAQAIAGSGGQSYGDEMRKRTANLLVGSRGLPDTGIGFGVADAPLVTGIPLLAADVANAANRGNYGEAALGAALPAAFYARKPIMAAGRAVYDAGRRAVDVAGDVLGRVPAPIAAGAAGAAAMTPEEAQAGKIDAAVRAAKKIVAPAEKRPDLFDYSRLGDVPHVRQFDLPRNEPPRGVPPRVTEMIASPDVRDEMLKTIEQGERMGGSRWYNADPLRDKFVEQFGTDRGGEAFRKYMDFVAATSPRSEVGANVRNASYYYNRAMSGQGMPPVGERNPAPYGHLAQRLHQMNAERVAGAGWDPLNNPKPASFVENLVGNQQPVTVDTHAFRLPAIIARDPRFLETAFQVSKDAPKQNIAKMIESGEISLDDAASRAAYWQAQPKANEYAALEQYYKSLGRDLGLTPAQTQAAAWVGGGARTGLKSDESKPFLRFVEDRIYKTADERNMDPQDVMRMFVRGESPLYARGGSVSHRAMMLAKELGSSPRATV